MTTNPYTEARSDLEALVDAAGAVFSETPMDSPLFGKSRDVWQASKRILANILAPPGVLAKGDYRAEHTRRLRMHGLNLQYDEREEIADMLEADARRWAQMRSEIEALDTLTGTDEDVNGYSLALCEALAILDRAGNAPEVGDGGEAGE